jgi:hypothetical protein
MPPSTPTAHLLTTFQARRQALWESLSLLAPAEWTAPILAGASPQDVLAARLADDLALLDALSASPAATRPNLSFEAMMEQGVATAQQLLARLQGLNNGEWQAEAPAPSLSDGGTTLAGWVGLGNDACAAAVAAVDAYLGSFERLGKQGLKRWLLFVYNQVMDSVAGMSESEIMGEPWYGEWNTYQVLEHVWAVNEQVLDIARQWGQASTSRSWRSLPVVGEHNRHVGKVYDGRDMVAVADAIVTVYRKTAQLIDRADPALLQRLGDYPWPGRGSLCHLIFETYRHAYEHAVEVRSRQVDR